MKVQSQSAFELIGAIGAPVVRAWVSTLRFKTHVPAPEVDPADRRYRGRYIYVIWHETILAMLGVRKPRGLSVLISLHRDGEYISQIARRFGVNVVRGSSTRGGREALAELVEVAERESILITPDGPRGPRRRLQWGAVVLAARTGLPIVPIGFGFTDAWRAKSWDRFALPKPYSLITAAAGRPISVPPFSQEQDLDPWRSRAESALLQCTAFAEQWADEIRLGVRHGRAA